MTKRSLSLLIELRDCFTTFVKTGFVRLALKIEKGKFIKIILPLTEFCFSAYALHDWFNLLSLNENNHGFQFQFLSRKPLGFCYKERNIPGNCCSVFTVKPWSESSCTVHFVFLLKFVLLI